MENKIIVDSCLDFNPEIFTADLPLERIPFKLRIDDEELVDQDLSTMLLVDKMKLSKNKVSTACPSPQEYLDAIDPERVNYIITISSKLSGSYNSAVMAAVMAQEEVPGLPGTRAGFRKRCRRGRSAFHEASVLSGREPSHERNRV